MTLGVFCVWFNIIQVSDHVDHFSIFAFSLSRHSSCELEELINHILSQPHLNAAFTFCRFAGFVQISVE